MEGFVTETGVELVPASVEYERGYLAASRVAYKLSVAERAEQAERRGKGAFLEGWRAYFKTYPR